MFIYFIKESILKRDVKSIEFSKNNIKVCDGNILVLNSYSSINSLVEYKNIIIIKYIPIKNSNHEEQVIFIPKNIFVNKDELIKLIPSNITRNNTDNITIDSNKNNVHSLRINDEIYEHIKTRAKKENISISSIINKALLDYLNNYI